MTIVNKEATVFQQYLFKKKTSANAGLVIVCNFANSADLTNDSTK